eukprot:CAMPEP_0172478904 /NCGR_PEP_ID=MMETSP1066-20121228/3139_1 /TAXON_ID=671091 /ORGANISM="Coscinodiscus wailesii, Strain CCMP2513" /LENGTH=54 /DNA_ID=CAMNT_0013238853 /DNA_START=69 /DNA_END=233 /DNA_ORIENTATION=-
MTIWAIRQRRYDGHDDNEYDDSDTLQYAIRRRQYDHDDNEYDDGDTIQQDGTVV